ncbi:hypothetical protein ATO8_19284 [Roseivivax marinus]|uniref:Uncharacterized protein n=1 Tax=Roseivivax marinus TaxID=1379903 RepID=W4HFT8_9RHOB|nr:SAM-dependent methyltransferase [Roseivivax marinus]ETW10996.1 hypothetical protein ATO8_19284 [Roseivivax marinus]
MTTRTITTDTAADNARKFDQYYTHPDYAAHCIAMVNALYPDQPFDNVVEPSAGSGSFSSQLGDNCIALDIDPAAPGIEQADYLRWQPAGDLGRCLVIGNPPFANQAALEFLNHAAQTADVVAMILPRTFCKVSQRDRVDRNFHLAWEETVPAFAFDYRGQAVDKPCVFQIWERRPEERPILTRKTRHPHFARCKSQADADVVIRRVGADAGRIKPLDQAWSPQSNIYLRAVECTPDELRARFEQLDMTSAARNGCGGGSINLTEIVTLYEDALEGENTVLPVVSTDGHASPGPNEESKATGQPGEKAPCPTHSPIEQTEPEPEHVWLNTDGEAATTSDIVARVNAAAKGTAKHVTFTAPPSIRKMSAQNRIDPHFHLVEQVDCAVEIVDTFGKNRTFAAVRQTWERRSDRRTLHRLASAHSDFEFCSRADADIAIQRVGAAAGRLKRPTDAGSDQSHTFVRATGCRPEELWARLATIDFDAVRHQTAAVPSIAKSEIVALYDAARRVAAAVLIDVEEEQRSEITEQPILVGSNCPYEEGRVVRWARG